MPGKCKFQDAWLTKAIYKDWLMKDVQDIHFARCRACSRSIKLQTMGEAALTSHAGGAGHKAAVRKLTEGNRFKSEGQINVSIDRNEGNKEKIGVSFQREALDRIAAGDWSNVHHSSSTTSVSHKAELQELGISSVYYTAPGTSRLISQHLQLPVSETEEVREPRLLHHDSIEQQQRIDALEQEHQMKLLEWVNRMKVLACEQELVREKKRAARQKEKAFRMKKAYYKAKLKRLGEDVPSSSSSSADEEEKNV